MEVGKGYKKTEVGVIPEDWDVFYLSECSKRIKDGEHWTPRRSSSGYYLLSARNVLNGRLDLSDVDFVEEDEYKRIRQRCNPDPGDVLISCSGSIGRVSTVPSGLKCVLVRSVAFVKPDPHKLVGEYAQYYLQSPEGQKQIFLKVNQGAQPNLFINHIEALSISLPPTLAEQEAIAEALSDADALIKSLETLLAKKRQVKQGAMSELLGGKRRVVESGEWKETSLGELGSTFGGLTGKTKTDFGNGTSQYITFMNIMSNVVIDSKIFERVNIRPSESQNRVRKGDLFFNGSSETPEEVGMCAVLTENVQDVFLNSFCFGYRFRESAEVNGLYFAYFFRSHEGRELMKSLAQGATRYNLSKTALLRLKFPLPDLAEQTAIAEILSDMDAEIRAVEKKLSKARAVKAGMMSELLTGRVRLVESGKLKRAIR